MPLVSASSPSKSPCCPHSAMSSLPWSQLGSLIPSPCPTTVGVLVHISLQLPAAESAARRSPCMFSCHAYSATATIRVQSQMSALHPSHKQRAQLYSSCYSDFQCTWHCSDMASHLHGSAGCLPQCPGLTDAQPASLLTAASTGRGDASSAVIIRGMQAARMARQQQHDCLPAIRMFLRFP